jgi:hypothetical protein
VAIVNVERNRTILEITIILFVFIVVNIASQVFQQPISYNQGQGWDGTHYFQVAEQISKGLKIREDAPFVYRIGTPFLVALFFKNNLLFGFKIVNIIANLLSTILLKFWLHLYLNNWRIRTFLVILFITHGLGSVRFTYFYPTLVDPWLIVILLIGLIGIERFRYRPCFSVVSLLGIVSFLGVMIRESALIIPIAFAFVTNPIPPFKNFFHSLSELRIFQIIKKQYQILFLPLLCAVLGILLVKLLASQNNDYSFMKAVIQWTYGKPTLTYLHSYFITYGLFIILPIYSWRTLNKFLWRNQFILIYLLGMIVLSRIGGADTERFLFWAMPVVYLLIGIAIQENKILLNSPWVLLFLVISLICSQRLFWIIPNYPNSFLTPIPFLTILSNKFQYLDLFSWYGKRVIQAISLFQYLFLSTILLLWLNHRAKVTKLTKD